MATVIASSGAAPEHTALVAEVLRAGRQLPDRVRAQALAAGESIVPALVALAVDEAASRENAPGGGYGPIHAVELLCDLRAHDAIDQLFKLLASTDPEINLHERLIRRMPDFGAALVEPGLRHLEGADDEHRNSVLAVLGNLSVRDERIFAALLDALRGNSGFIAMSLADYRDPRALPHLERALARVRLDDNTNMFGEGQDVIELAAAIEALGGELSAAGRAKKARVVAMRRAALAQFDSSLAERRTTVVKVGRNDPCPCGSGRKHK